MNQGSPWLNPQAFIKGSSWMAHGPGRELIPKGTMHSRGQMYLYPCIAEFIIISALNVKPKREAANKILHVCKRTHCVLIF